MCCRGIVQAHVCCGFQAAAFANYKDGDEAASEGSSDTAKESKSEPKPSSGGGGGDGGSGGGNKKFPAHTQLQMPALSPTMSAGAQSRFVTVAVCACIQASFSLKPVATLKR
jgi:hypothetical protein